MRFCCFEDPSGFFSVLLPKKFRKHIPCKGLQEELIRLLVADDLQQRG
jgi:hypothetical protein